jgi:hypothetical protein
VAREEPVEERRVHASDMKEPRRTGSEADADRHMGGAAGYHGGSPAREKRARPGRKEPGY